MRARGLITGVTVSLLIYATIGAAVLGTITLAVHLGIIRSHQAARPAACNVYPLTGLWVYPLGSSGPVTTQGVKIIRDVTCTTARPSADGTVVQRGDGLMIYEHGKVIYLSQYVTYDHRL